MNYRDQLNDRIRAAKHAITDAAFAGVRGEAMLALKAELRRLKAEHARFIGK